MEVKEYFVVLKNGVTFAIKASDFDFFKGAGDIRTEREKQAANVIAVVPDQIVFDPYADKRTKSYLPFSEVVAVIPSETSEGQILRKVK